jgi:hypothetical protein
VLWFFPSSFYAFFFSQTQFSGHLYSLLMLNMTQWKQGSHLPCYMRGGKGGGGWLLGGALLLFFQKESLGPLEAPHDFLGCFLVFFGGGPMSWALDKPGGLRWFVWAQEGFSKSFPPPALGDCFRAGPFLGKGKREGG